MPDAGWQIWEIRVPKDVELSPLKNKMSKNKTKMLKRGTKKNGESKMMEKRKRDKWKDNEKCSLMKWSLVKITLKHNLGVFIFSFETINPAYITYLKVHFDWTWILGLKSFFLEKSFIINKAVVSFPQPTKNLDQSFTCSGRILNCQVHNRTIKKMMKMKRKNKTLGWKPKKAV